jgi:hypothetical protein
MRRLGLLILLAWSLPASALAHHEAIYGTQSALVLSSGAYVTAQLFTRQTGPETDRQQETTTVLSAAVTPFRGRPWSFSVTLPFSTLSHGGDDRTGLENAILGIRYHLDLPGVTAAIDGRESFAMVVGGVELPSGTLDHDFGDGAFAAILAGLMSVEKGQFSAIGYGAHRRPGTHGGAREGSNLFLGGGVAWTPVDEEDRIFSLQLGVSHETTFDERLDGLRLAQTGGSGVFAHPTVLFGLSQRVLFFGQTALSMHQDWDDSADRERYRVGAGVILKLGQ